MDFKAARCPTCGGSLQISDELNTVKCMYCGGEVIVREAIRLAAGKVKEFTLATPIEKIIDHSAPFPIEQYKKQGYTIIAALSGIGLLIALLVGGASGIFIAGVFIIFAVLVRTMHLSKVKGLEQANKEMSKIKPHKQVIGYKGQCPYCDSDITITPNVPGADCPVCHKRIVIRDSKFHSVDTPVSGLKK